VTRKTASSGRTARRNAAQPAAEVKAAIVEAVQTFRRSAKPSDDITVVVVKRT
jgi:serine phosphatase RsbU (regulator of sigma subunit)